MFIRCSGPGLWDSKQDKSESNLSVVWSLQSSRVFTVIPSDNNTMKLQLHSMKLTRWNKSLPTRRRFTPKMLLQGYQAVYSPETSALVICRNLLLGFKTRRKTPPLGSAPNFRSKSFQKGKVSSWHVADQRPHEWGALRWILSSVTCDEFMTPPIWIVGTSGDVLSVFIYSRLFNTTRSIPWTILKHWHNTEEIREEMSCSLIPPPGHQTSLSKAEHNGKAGKVPEHDATPRTCSVPANDWW